MKECPLNNIGTLYERTVSNVNSETAFPKACQSLTKA